MITVTLLKKNYLYHRLKKGNCFCLKQKNKKGFQWSNDSITNALKIKFTCRTSGYEELLNLNYPLPSL